MLMLIAEAIGLRTGDPVWRALARKWSKTFGILFVVGAVSGTIISFELGLLWPSFMRYAGGIVGLPFSLEGFAFFTERSSSARNLFDVEIPYLLSLLAYDDPDSTVRGLKSWPKDERPDDIALIRLSWLFMVGVGVGLVVLMLWY
jgi:cytochrome bd-type quinol oxidase subunit 1